MTFRVFHSDMKYESKWETVETDIFIWMSDYVLKNYRIYDADHCGDESVEFVVDREGELSFYRFTYSWWIDYDPEWDLKDSIHYEVVPEVKFSYPAIDRDWIKL
jgi:hypothetical protein